MSWDPWSDAARLRAENSTLRSLLKTQTRELAKDLANEKMVSKVLDSNNSRLNRDIYVARCEMAALKQEMATMHRRDPVTGRLLPRGK